MGISAVLSKLGTPQHYTFIPDFSSFGDVVEHAASGLTNSSVEIDPFLTKTSSETYLDAEGWNNFKNVEVIGDDTEATAFLNNLLSDDSYGYSEALAEMYDQFGIESVVLNNFVHVDADFSDYTRTVDLDIYNCKRANIVTGYGDDDVYVSVLTNGDSWSNEFYIETGVGTDTVTFDAGDASAAENDTFDFVEDGSLSTVHYDMGGDGYHDYLIIKTAIDFELTNFELHADVITVEGSVLESVEDNVATFSMGDETFTITADVSLESYAFDIA